MSQSRLALHTFQLVDAQCRTVIASAAHSVQDEDGMLLTKFHNP